MSSVEKMSFTLHELKAKIIEELLRMEELGTFMEARQARDKAKRQKGRRKDDSSSDEESTSSEIHSCKVIQSLTFIASD